LKFENVVFPDGIAFNCKGCGRCCKEQPADVTIEEQKRIETKGYTEFIDEKDLTEPRLIRTNKKGGCFFLAENNSCLIHDVKPAICQIVPFMVMDWDYEKNLIELDLPVDCACPGITEGDHLQMESIGKAAQKYVRNLLETVAKEEQLPITDKKTLSETRQLIIKIATEEQNAT
jgi:Fe-S-cluster containining protein